MFHNSSHTRQTLGLTITTTTGMAPKTARKEQESNTGIVEEWGKNLWDPAPKSQSAFSYWQVSLGVNLLGDEFGCLSLLGGFRVGGSSGGGIRAFCVLLVWLFVVRRNHCEIWEHTRKHFGCGLVTFNWLLVKWLYTNVKSCFRMKSCYKLLSNGWHPSKFLTKFSSGMQYQKKAYRHSKHVG